MGNKLNEQLSLFGDDAILADQTQEESQENQGINLFNEDEIKEAEQKKKQKEEKKSTAAKAKTNLPAKPEKKEIKVDHSWIISYYGNRFTVREFFPNLGEGETVTLEKLRQEMQKDYFEMSKERTDFEVDEERKVIIPIVKGTSKAGGSYV
jgi:hypothetical protein